MNIFQERDIVAVTLHGCIPSLTCHLSRLAPLKGIAEYFKVGYCVETSESEMLESQKGLIWKGQFPYAVAEKVVVEVFAADSCGIIRVKTYDGKPLEHSHSSMWPLDVPVFACRRLQWSILSPQHCMDNGMDGKLSINFTSLVGVEVASGFEFHVHDSLPATFWQRASKQVHVPEGQIAVVLPDGRTFNGHGIHRITHVQDLL